MIVTEDSKSGKIFWENMLSKLRLIDLEEGNSSNSLVEVMLEKAMSYNGKVLVALDYDSGLTSMMHIIKNDNIDKSRIAFIPMESFEEVLCNSEFILSKFPEMRDKVINYQNYIDASYKHTGAYFSRLLYNYVKVKSPLKEDGSKNVTKFYDKGMKNFKECFIDNCCVYELGGCKLFYSGNKKDAMLNNKFEFLQIFM